MSEQQLSAEEKALLAEADNDDAKSAKRKRKEPEADVKPEASKEATSAKDTPDNTNESERGPFAPAQYDGDDGWNGLPVQMRG